MKTIMASLILAATATIAVSAADTRCFEMRTYYAPPGKLDALQARFREHTCRLFEKHGMTNIGYWLPEENPDSRLIYVLAYPDRDAREKAWKAFLNDPDWKAAAAESEKNGKLVAKIDSVFLQATDFSPEVKPSVATEPRVFELREYTAEEGRLANLLARFRDHTVKLFEKHGMQNLAYWTPAERDQGAEYRLIYILGHTSREAAAASFKAFRADPAWLDAKKASEEKAGGSLTVQNGVKSTYMKPTDFSPTR